MSNQLKAWLDDHEPYLLAVPNGDKALAALRAVVELHQPAKTETRNVWCQECARLAGEFEPWPCPTIRAIDECMARKIAIEKEVFGAD